jgi:hypothetical protein
MTQLQQRFAEDLAIIRQWAQGGREVAYPEIDTINALIGDGVNPLTPGIAAAIRVDFNALITGCYLQEIDGTTGSVSVELQRAPGGTNPAFVSITGASNPGIVSGRWFLDETLAGWTTQIRRGDYLRYIIAGATAIARVHVGLRIRRLEP